VTAVLKRLILVVVIVCLILAAVSELVLPGVLARGLEGALEASFGSSSEHKVRLKAYPSVRMLLGYFDEISVISTNVETSTLVLQSLAVTLEDASVDMKALLTERSLKVARSQTGRVTITVSQRNLEDYLARNVPAFKEPRVLMTPDAVVISGYLTVLERDFVCSLTGRFLLSGPSTVGFTIEGFAVNDVPVPPAFMDTWLDVLGHPDLSVDLGAFPLPLTGTEVLAEDGKMTIKATTGGGS
jgi:hypothetical protein